MNAGFRSMCIGLALVTASCGGGGNDSAPVVAVSPPPSPPLSPPPSPPDIDFVGGTWFGTTVNDATMSTEVVTAMMSEDGRFRLLWLDLGTLDRSDGLMTGNVAISESAFTADGLAYAATGTTWSDGSLISTVTITGTIDRSEGTMTGGWASASGDSGSFQLHHVDIYWGSDSSPRHIEGVWVAIDTSMNAYAAITIDGDGSFSGQDARGCNFTGRFSPIEPRANMYDVQTTISGCDIAGGYSGLAMRDGWYDVVYLSIDDNVRAILALLARS